MADTTAAVVAGLGIATSAVCGAIGPEAATPGVAVADVAVGTNARGTRHYLC